MLKYNKQRKIMGDVVRPWDFFNPNEKKDKNLLAERLEICKVCPSFNKLTVGCNECGCFLKMKAKMERATCPLGKW